MRAIWFPSQSRLLSSLVSLFVATGFCVLATTAAAQTITLWEQERKDVQDVLDRHIAEFQTANPKIKIKRSHYKNEDLRTQFQTSAIGGRGGDILIAPNDFAGPFSVMGIIQPVQGWIKPGNFTESVLAAVTDQSGELWGIPISGGNHLMLFVNKRLVKNPPQTLEELIAVAREQTDAKKKTFGLAYNLNEPFWFVSFLGAFGQRPLTNAKPTLESQAMVDALQLVKNLKFKDKVVPPDCDYSCAETLFMEEKAAMTINGDWAIEKFRAQHGDNLAIAPLPKLAKTGKFMAPMVSGKYIFFNAKLKGKKLKAAQAFAAYLTSEKIQNRLTASTGRLPSLKQLSTGKMVSSNAVLKATRDAMAHGQPMPMNVEMRVVWDAIRPQLQAVMAGRTEPKLAASVMQKDADAKIKQLKQ